MVQMSLFVYFFCLSSRTMIRDLLSLQSDGLGGKLLEAQSEMGGGSGPG